MKPNPFFSFDTRKSFKFLNASLLVAAAGLACGSSFASPASEAQAVLRAEMAACKAGTSPQGRDTCIYEAQSAYAENRRGTLADDGTDYMRNSRLRCEAMSGCERTVCMSRVQDQVSGKTTPRPAGADVCIVPAGTRAPVVQLAPVMPMAPLVPSASKNPQ